MSKHRIEEFVRKAGEQNQTYIHDLMLENERLRARAAELGIHLLKNIDEVEKIPLFQGQINNLQTMVSLLDQQLVETRKLYTGALEEAGRYRGELDKLRQTLSAVHEENLRFKQQYERVEHANGNLINLFVTTYRLHATLDRKEVLASINETVINLIGSEDFAVYELDPDGCWLHLVNSFGINGESFQRVALGAGPIGRAAQAGELLILDRGHGENGLPEGKALEIFIPLKLSGEVTGGIAIFSLLPQKDVLEELDRELFDLLSCHAATALYSTRLHAVSDRI